MGGKQLMSVAPKDGHLYGFDLADNSLLYRVPVTQVEDPSASFSHDTAVHSCPGAVGGAEWNSPAYDPPTNLILIGEVDWCDTVTPKDANQLRSVPLGQPWAGMATWNPFDMFGKVGRTEGHWAGWVYAADADTGQKLWSQELGGAIGGGVITYTANGAQKIAVASGFTMLAWPTKIVTAKVVILGLESSANP
jgi:PQQ enzyme-like repeat protein